MSATNRPTTHPEPLTDRQREILEFIEKTVGDKGYPPSVREIGSAVGLTSPSTVHTHLLTLQRLGYLRRDPSKPRAIEVRYDASSGATGDRRPVRHVPLVGDVAAGTGVLANENVEELVPLPVDFTGDGELFMLRVRGDSMIGDGIFDGDFVVVRSQVTAENGDIVIAGIPGEEATVKTFSAKGDRVTLTPSNPSRTHGVRGGRDRRVRQGRHRAAQALSTPDRNRSVVRVEGLVQASHEDPLVSTSTAPDWEFRRNSSPDRPLSATAFVTVPSGRVTRVPAVT